jgi:hypothetical protein
MTQLESSGELYLEARMSRRGRRQTVGLQDQHRHKVQRPRLLERPARHAGSIAPEEIFEKRRDAEGHSQLPVYSNGFPQDLHRLLLQMHC